ncbi:MAG: sigma-70 family RNA polymerase sigma factor [bacterium]
MTLSQAENSDVKRQQQIDDLLAVAQRQDTEAFSRLFDHFVPLIRSFCLSANPGATIPADDIAQEVMIKVWRKAKSYRPEAGAVSTWIFTLARNARIDYLRKNGRYLSDIDVESVWGSVPDDGPDPFQVAHQRRNEQLIRDGLTTLPIDQREVLGKVYLEGKSHSEVSEELGLPLGTVKSRIRLALKKMAVSFER